MEIDAEYENQFQNFDKDKNGKITKDEMHDFILKLFGMQLDQISFEQLEAHLKKKQNEKRNSSGI